jgi:hypothetical protein
MIQVQGTDEIARHAADALSSGNPLTILAWLSAIALMIAAVVVVKSMIAAGRRESREANSQKTRDEALQDYLKSNAESNRRIAESSTQMALLLGDIKINTGQTIAQMQAWGNSDWLRDDVGGLKDGLTAVHADVRATQGDIHAVHADVRAIRDILPRRKA